MMAVNPDRRLGVHVGFYQDVQNIVMGLYIPMDQ